MMQGNFIEVEIKFPLRQNEVDRVKALLADLEEVKYEGRFYEKTNNYDNVGKLMEREDARLRIREIGLSREDDSKRVEFCYKKRVSVDGVKKEEEIESHFTTNIYNFVKIINKMGYEFVDGYERYRETYKYKNTKITIDTFPFGVLLEIEGEESDILNVTKLLGLNLESRYNFSCDDFYIMLCEQNHIKPKNFITFDDIEMPQYK